MDIKKIPRLTLKDLKPYLPFKVGIFENNTQTELAFSYTSTENLLKNISYKLYPFTFKKINCISDNLRDIVFLSKIFPHWDFFNDYLKPIFPYKNRFCELFSHIFTLGLKKYPFWAGKKISKNFFLFVALNLTLPNQISNGELFIFDLKLPFIFQQTTNASGNAKLLLNLFHSPKMIKLLLKPITYSQTTIVSVPEYIFHQPSTLIFTYKNRIFSLDKNQKLTKLVILQ